MRHNRLADRNLAAVVGRTLAGIVGHTPVEVVDHRFVEDLAHNSAEKAVDHILVVVADHIRQALHTVQVAALRTALAVRPGGILVHLEYHMKNRQNPSVI